MGLVLYQPFIMWLVRRRVQQAFNNHYHRHVPWCYLRGSRLGLVFIVLLKFWAEPCITPPTKVVSVRYGRIDIRNRRRLLPKSYWPPIPYPSEWSVPPRQELPVGPLFFQWILYEVEFMHNSFMIIQTPELWDNPWWRGIWRNRCINRRSASIQRRCRRRHHHY